MKTTEPDPNRRILIVDDNASIHADFRNILCPDNSDEEATEEMEAVLFGSARPRELSFDLDSAYQGQEALNMVKKALAEKRPYALAFVDVRMPPGWDGIETIAHL
jgi:CheY-like chemotaxis protein